MVKISKRIKTFGICAILLCLTICFATVNAAEDTDTELPSPISFKCDAQLVKNAVLIDTVNFALSESNPAITYTISETDSDLIFVFNDVSTSINVTLIEGDGSKYCVGFHGKSNQIYAQIIPGLEYTFELSLGVISSADMKQTEIVDCCSGLLKIYQLPK